MLKMCTKSCSFKQIKINWCYLVAPSLVSWAWRSPASSPAPPGSHLEKKNYPIRLSNTNHWKFELFQKKKVKKTINHWKIVCFFTCSTRWPGSHLEKKKLPSQSRKIYLLPNLSHQSIFKGKNLAINEKCSALSPSPPESHPEKKKGKNHNNRWTFFCFLPLSAINPINNWKILCFIPFSTRVSPEERRNYPTNH